MSGDSPSQIHVSSNEWRQSYPEAMWNRNVPLPLEVRTSEPALPSGGAPPAALRQQKSSNDRMHLLTVQRPTFNLALVMKKFVEHLQLPDRCDEVRKHSPSTRIVL